MAKVEVWSKELEDVDVSKYEGFVYQISNTSTGEKYIGKKSFWSVIKGKRKESAWRVYRSSNEKVQGWDVDDCEFKVLHLCGSKFELTYTEIKAMVDADALLRDDYLNYMMGSQHIGRCPGYMKKATH